MFIQFSFIAFPTDEIYFQYKENTREKGASGTRVGRRSLLSTLLLKKRRKKNKKTTNIIPAEPSQ